MGFAQGWNDSKGLSFWQGAVAMCEGILAELEGVDLGDKRLDRRSKKLLEALAANPEASINAACDGWADTNAAYRFFDNSAVTPEKIHEPHRAATVERIRQQPVALIVQDTTELDYTAHAPRDAQCLNRPERRGLYDHTHLALTPDQLCLGVVGCEQFDRTPESLGQADQRSTLPIEEKESLRWLTGYRLACRLAAECPDTQIVSVADREADIYDIFVEAQQASAPRAEYVIRARVERCLTERDLAAGAAAYCKVADEVRAAPLLGKRTIELAQTPQRAAREATLEVRALTVTIKPPHARSHLPAVTLQVVLAEEVGGPSDGTAVSWLLLTSLPAATLAEALLVLDYYVARWLIEVYFRVLKTGCRVEEIQLETTARLKNCLAFYKIIAARVLYLTHLNRTAPEISCAAVFTDAEWKSVWCVMKKKEPLPQQPPQLSEFMKLLTQLGGYNNRATEAPPGPQPLWIGIRRMLDFARAWLAFGPESGKAKCV
jgi:hypothetical protein